MIKKVIYIGFQHEFGLKENGDSTNNRAFYQNFMTLNYDVTPVWYDDYTVDELQNKIISEADRIKPDMIFFVLQLSQIKVETLKQLTNKGYFIVNWFGDDQWRFENFSIKYAKYFNVCITTDKFSLHKYKQSGIENIIRSQWACSSESSVELSSNYKYDVSFIGGVSPYRKWFVNELSKRGIDVACFGDGWDNGRVVWSEMESIFLRSKINLNVSNSVQYDVRYLLRNPRNIVSTLRSPKNRSQTKARIFEIPVYGGFLMTEYVPSLEDYFDIGKEIISYKDVDEAELLINYYLENESEREEIKRLGVKKAREQHTFKSRIIEFMEEINSIKLKANES